MQKLMMMAGLLFVITAGNAQEFEKGERMHKPRNGKAKTAHLLENLPDATDSQKAQIQALFDKGKADMKAKHESLKQIKDQMTAIKRDNDPSVAEMNRLIDQAWGIKAEIAKDKYKKHVELMSLLTDEQNAWMKERHEMKRKRGKAKRMHYKKKRLKDGGENKN